MAISAGMVKELRELTGAGMMDCKKALVETDGDIQKAIEYMRENGLAKAAKKAGRIAAEGLVVAKCSGDFGAVLEVNIETDFAAKNEAFINLTSELLEHVVTCKPANVEEMLAQKFYNADMTVEEYVREAILKIGENIQVRRFEIYNLNGCGLVDSYIHGGGKIGVMVEINTDSDDTAKNEEVAGLIHDIALHIAAYNPTCISKDDVTAEDLDKEREILRAQVLNEGKPENIVDKIVEGKINNYYKEVCLLEQGFVKEPKMTVKAVIADLEKKIGGQIAVTRFTRFELGEGIEKKEENFAEEVAKQIGK